MKKLTTTERFRLQHAMHTLNGQSPQYTLGEALEATRKALPDLEFSTAIFYRYAREFGLSWKSGRLPVGTTKARLTELETKVEALTRRLDALEEQPAGVSPLRVRNS